MEATIQITFINWSILTSSVPICVFSKKKVNVQCKFLMTGLESGARRNCLSHMCYQNG